MRPAPRSLTDSWIFRLSREQTELFNETFESLYLRIVGIFLYEGDRIFGDLDNENLGDILCMGSSSKDGWIGSRLGRNSSSLLKKVYM